jgi:hypothetical protein
MKPQHQNNTFIDRKKCSLASLRGKPPIEKHSITIIIYTKNCIPSTPIYAKYINQKNNLEEDLLEAKASIRYS